MVGVCSLTMLDLLHEKLLGLVLMYGSETMVRAVQMENLRSLLGQENGSPEFCEVIKVLSDGSAMWRE